MTYKKRSANFPPIRYYKESIIMMMRYGKSVDRIASELKYPEQMVIDYIKSEGIDSQLGRRSWQWKSAKKKHRTVASYNSSRNIP